jgi:hypothetical protein
MEHGLDQNINSLEGKCLPFKEDSELCLKIEEMEMKLLKMLYRLVDQSIDEFSTRYKNSLKYLNEISLQIIMASYQKNKGNKEKNKVYNPFSEIIEKYIWYILVRKLEKEEYKLLPLGYSSDLTMEANDHVLNLDIKTANWENRSDFRGSIPLGLNQFTHKALITKGRKNDFFNSPLHVYPATPPCYLIHSNIKFVYTFALLFIYPPYKEIVEEINTEYEKLYNLFYAKFLNIIENDKKLSELKNEERKRIVVENLIRAVFIHDEVEVIDYLSIPKEEVIKFKEQLNIFVEKILKRDIRPIAINLISIPNGLLEEKYLNHFISGKNWGKSVRYYYSSFKKHKKNTDKGKKDSFMSKLPIFKLIYDKTREEFPRVLFPYLDERYKEDIKKLFEGQVYKLEDRIIVL